MGSTNYSDAEKRRICAEYAVYGDPHIVSERTGVRLVTLKSWLRAGWFKDLLATMQSQQTNVAIAKANRALSTALDELEDRLHRGDIHVVHDKQTGQPYQYRAPIKARDLSTIVNVLATRSEKAASIVAAQQTSYQLSDLQQSFRQFATSYRAKQVQDQTAIELRPENESYEDNQTEESIAEL
jgi:transposase-like protein